MHDISPDDPDLQTREARHPVNVPKVADKDCRQLGEQTFVFYCFSTRVVVP
ncbi:hypothetical protein D3C73_1666730 [compost metagenome]